ncbi:MAG TPA: maleylpyruvate isomerase family mycothiol-dependent enzyme [Candidatus Dormibacteraeota bacterium]|nr:maleylpyruvate isomerase family mycothiol-dependent enzyme [Candidatus Dormibacteraeota bacterium]
MATNQVASPADLWALTHEQREKVGDMLATLNDAEWETPSLCAGWRVRDVVAHMVETHQMTPPRFMGRFIGAGFNFDRFSAKDVGRHATQSTADLLQEFRDSAPRSTAPPGPKQTWLAEAVIHGEDAARPTGRTVAVSPQALVTVAEYARRTSPLLHGKQRSDGLRLRATDVDWAAGDGPEVSGPALSLILAITGRKVALADLSGEGLETLRPRL